MHMDFLIFTDNKDNIDLLDTKYNFILKDNKIDYSDFSNVSKNLKKINNYGCIIIPVENSMSSKAFNNILFLSGYACACNIPVYTNCKELQNSSSQQLPINYFESTKEIQKQVKANFKNILKEASVRIAKNKLLDKGIPFSSDAFAFYIEKKKKDIINLFIDAEINLNSTDDEQTPLLNIAVRNENIDLVKTFLKKGVDINAVSKDRGYTAVMDAVWLGNIDIAKLLIKENAELNTINKEGQTNLILAVGADEYDICKLLISNGADPDIKDQMGMSAYKYAELFKKTKIQKLLEPYHKN